MKKFKYFNQSVTVPDYAKFIATDEDGEVWWYVCEPYIVLKTWLVKDSGCGRVGNNPNIKNWRRSLREC